MSTTVRSNFNTLYNRWRMHRLQQRIAGKRIEGYDGQNTFAAIAGVSQPTISRLIEDDATSISYEVIGKLLDAFAAEGMPVTLADLFVVED